MSSDNITQILQKISGGEPQAWSDLMGLIYDDLNRNAAAFLNREKPGHPLQPSDLVHEAYLRLQKQTRVQWKNRTQFFAVASLIMERILIDQSRRNRQVAPLNTSMFAESDRNVSTPIDRIREVIEKLERLKPEHGLIVRMRFFGGLTVEEVAEFLDVSKRDVERDWTFIKCWMQREFENMDKPR